MSDVDIRMEDYTMDRPVAWNSSPENLYYPPQAPGSGDRLHDQVRQYFPTANVQRIHSSTFPHL